MAIEIVARASTCQPELALTRSGGIFAAVPCDHSDAYADGGNLTPEADLHAKLQFAEDTASAANLLLCEFALSGVVSEPVSPGDLAYGQEINNHAAVVVAGGGRETYWHRGLEVTHKLISGTLVGQIVNPWTPEGTACEAARLARASHLQAVHSALPSLVVASYYAYSRYQMTQASALAWVAIEQVLEHLWEQHVHAVGEGKRSGQLRDTRTYTSAVRTEVLQTAGKLPDDLAAAVHSARKARNDVMHKAVMSEERARVCLEGLHCFLEFILRTSVAPPLTSRGVTW